MSNISVLPWMIEMIHNWYKYRIESNLLDNIENDRLQLIVNMILSNDYNLGLEPIDAFHFLSTYTDPIYFLEQK